jgi:hypothetical protein
MQERPPIWRVAANILNKRSRTADKGGPATWGLGEVLKTPHRKIVSSYEPFTKASTPVSAVMNLRAPYTAGNFLIENRLASPEGLCSME